MTFWFLIDPPTWGYQFTRRVLDIVVAAVGLLLSLPLLLLVSVVLLATDGSVFFRQMRIGKDGRPFTILKFRTMSTVSDPYARKPTRNAPEITPIGRYLRKTGLDELPQLWNVLTGSMSLVGPRPEMSFIVDEYDSLQRLRLNARPGVTGFWQISTVRMEPIHHHIEYDLFYLANRGLLFDLWIMLRTPLVLLAGRSITLDPGMAARWERPRRRPAAARQTEPIRFSVGEVTAAAEPAAAEGGGPIR
ncbi:MAG TPA: sugar transferase [Gemmatimonadales bacterium]|nr:sugar transferase [Gemmatimonadales bacterium]